MLEDHPHRRRQRLNLIKARISLRMYRNFQGALPFREIEEAALNEPLSTTRNKLSKPLEWQAPLPR